MGQTSSATCDGECSSTSSASNNTTKCLFSTIPRKRKFGFLMKKQKSAKRHTKPFRELLSSWPESDIGCLYEEFKANERLLELRRICDSARRKSANVGQCLYSSIPSFGDFTLENQFIVHKAFFIKRCPNGLNDESCSRDDFERFIRYVYTEEWDGDKYLLAKLCESSGLKISLSDAFSELYQEDQTSGDLEIVLQKDDKVQITTRCSSVIAASRSSVFSQLIKRRAGAGRIVLDEEILPAQILNCFIHFLYTDELDLSLIHPSSSTLSEVRAMISGRDQSLNHLLNLAHVGRFFCVEKLVDVCEDFIVRAMSTENVIPLLGWARDCGSNFVVRHSIRMIEENFEKISVGAQLFDLTHEDMLQLLQSTFLQGEEVEILEACIRWGEHELLRRMEEREPNVVADTCHSISRRGLRKAELSGEELRGIVGQLTEQVRKDYILPPFHQKLTDAYNRRVLTREPLREDLVVCSATKEINPDVHWLKPSDASPGPRFYRHYMQVLESSSFESKEQISQPVKILVRNTQPHVLDEDKFVEAESRIRETMEEISGIVKIDQFPRLYHKMEAVRMITGKALAELDIDPDCVEVTLGDVDRSRGATPDVLSIYT